MPPAEPDRYLVQIVPVVCTLQRPSPRRESMDLTTFENLHATLKAHPAKADFLVEEYPAPRSFQVIVRHVARPRILHHLVIFPSAVKGMVVRKWWTHDHDVGIQTPTQGPASPEMVLQHLQQLLAPEIGQNV